MFREGGGAYSSCFWKFSKQVMRHAFDRIILLGSLFIGYVFEMILRVPMSTHSMFWFRNKRKKKFLSGLISLCKCSEVKPLTYKYAINKAITPFCNRKMLKSFFFLFAIKSCGYPHYFLSQIVHAQIWASLACVFVSTLT